MGILIKKTFILFGLSIILVTFNVNSIAQGFSKKSTAKQAWTTNNPFQTDVFVENFGQFDKWAKTQEPIKYALNNSNKIFFTQHGLTFRLDKIKSNFEEKQDKKTEKEVPPKIETYYVNLFWEDCNNNVEILASGQTENYYTFGEQGYENIKAKGYRKLIYKNLYNGIDVEYIIPKEGGIKYSLVVHPGADVRVVKMQYSGNVEMTNTDSAGNIVITTPAGNITDHAPQSYIEETSKNIISAFKLIENIVSFQIEAENSNPTTNNHQPETIIIDPWTTTPASLTTDNCAYDIDFDKYGNAYVAGGTPPYHKLAKYSSSGILLWTFTNPTGWSSAFSAYSKFCIIPRSGSIFIGEGWSWGPKIMKISSSGSLVLTSANFSGSEEIWLMFYNRCTGQIIGFGGGTQTPNNLQQVNDTNLTGNTVKNFNGNPYNGNDVADAIMDYNGDFYALMASNSSPDRLIKSLVSNNYLPPVAFDVYSGYSLTEGHNFGISGFNGSGFYGFTNRQNALDLNKSYLYSYDGKTIFVWNKSSGISVDTLIVNATYAAGMNRNHEGIAVDECNNVYAGGSNIVHVYNHDSINNIFSPLSSITSNINGEVYDVRLDRTNNILYVCGNGFVTVTPAVTCFISNFNITTTSDSCAGTASVSASGGTPPYTYLWSTGATTSSISGLSPGNYIVTVSDNSCIDLTQIDTVHIGAGVNINISNDTSICQGNSVTLTVNGGISYIWSNGYTSSTIVVTPTAVTTYTVSVTGSNGCTVSSDVTVSFISVTANAGTDQIICNGQNANLTAYGGVNYQWSNGVNTQSINVSPAITTTFIVTATDPSGCTATDDIQVTVNQLPPANAGADTSICFSESVTLNAGGGITYQWSPTTGLSDANISNPVANPSTTTTYILTVTDNNGCSNTDDILVTVFSPVSVGIHMNPPSICEGDSVILTANINGGNGNNSFSWAPGISATTQSVTVFPTITTMYHVTVTNNCNSPSSVDSMLVTVFPAPIILFSADTLFGCQPLTVNFTDSSTPTISSWAWDFGDVASAGNNNSILQNPTHIYNGAGIYSVTLAVISTDGCKNSYTFQNMINVFLTPLAEFSMHPDTTTIENSQIDFTDQSLYADFWNWNFGDPASGQNSSSLQNPFHIFSNIGTFNILLIVNTNHGCKDTVSHTIYIKDIFTIYIPSAFTPNGNGENDYFLPLGVNWDPNHYEMSIFNRWGELIYQTNTIGDKWNGTMNNNGTWDDAVVDVYVYYIKVKELNGPEHVCAGRVTLVK